MPVSGRSRRHSSWSRRRIPAAAASSAAGPGRAAARRETCSGIAPACPGRCEDSVRSRGRDGGHAPGIANRTVRRPGSRRARNSSTSSRSRGADCGTSASRERAGASRVGSRPTDSRQPPSHSSRQRGSRSVSRCGASCVHAAWRVRSPRSRGDASRSWRPMSARRSSTDTKPSAAGGPPRAEWDAAVWKDAAETRTATAGSEHDTEADLPGEVRPPSDCLEKLSTSR